MLSTRFLLLLRVIGTLPFLVAMRAYASDLSIASGYVSSSAVEAASCCGPITPAGLKLRQLLDDSRVERLWLNHRHVNWETGEADKPASYVGPGRHTHCSAFAAAIGARLNIYMLRPPEHGQSLLASAQTAWFSSSAGKNAGWYPVEGALQAQTRANQGSLVVITYASPHPKRPGHIAIVRPSLKSLPELLEQGPQITQAGLHNAADWFAAAGFAAHPGAWPDGVRYFAHDIPD